MKIRLKELKIMPFVFCCLAVFQASVSYNVFPFLQPVSYLSLAGCLLGFLTMTAISIKQPNFTRFELLIVLFYILLLVFSFIQATDIKNCFYYAINVWLVLLLFNYYNHQLPLLLKSIAFAFSAAIYANCMLMVLFPDWMFAAEDVFDSFLLGGNYNQMGCRLFTGILCNVVCIGYSRKWLINSIILIIISILTLAFVGSMTSLSAIILFSILCLIPFIRVKKLIVLGYFLFLLLFHFFVVFSGEGLHNNKLAVYIIEDVLNKDVTFTYRTDMWESALKVIGESPIYGYGFVDKDWYLGKMSSFAIGPHNTVLGILIYGGITLLLLILSISALAILRMQNHSDKIGMTLLIGLMTLLLMQTFELFPLFFFFLIITLIYYYPRIQESYNKTTEPANS